MPVIKIYNLNYVCKEFYQLEGHSKCSECGYSNFGACHTQLISLFNNFFFPFNYAIFQ